MVDRKKTKQSKPEIVQQPVAQLIKASAGYKELLEDLKNRIRASQLRAGLAVNKELILLYWDIGRQILHRQKQEGWGAKVIDRLARDLNREFPEMKGFSPRNLKYMRSFAEVYPDKQIVQQAAAQIPWFHNCVIINKVRGHEERMWYIRQTIENGWSRNILTLQIENELYRRQGKAISNFRKTLPSPQSDLAHQTLKDPYIFDFLTLDKEAHERAIEKELVNHITKFLLEDRVLAEYALRDIKKPISVAEWKTKLTRSLPKNLKGSLPSIEELEESLSASSTLSLKTTKGASKGK